MRKKFTLTTTVLVFLFFIVACKKDSNGGPLDGTWTFTSMEGHDSASNSYNDGSESLDISILNYLTTNNKGTVSIGGGNMTAKGLSYSIDTILYSRSYKDGSLWYDFPQSFSIDAPVTNSSSSFRLVGTDSIYFPAGGFATIGSSVEATTAAGYKYVLSGKTLTMTLHMVKDSTDNSNGYPEQLHEDVKATVTLTKQ